MFYAGEKTWKFRFTGVELGKWTYTTASDDPELDGWSGEITVTANPNPKITGFLTHVGNKFAVQRGPEGKLEGYLLNVYMDMRGKLFADPRFEFLPTDLDELKKMIVAYHAAARNNGCEVLYTSVRNSWFKRGVPSYTKHDSEDPDLQTFAMLDTMITTAHSAGGRMYIWAWGDEQRKETPHGIARINDASDRRLQRYIAARLGPLPGWQMGYCFDGHEWVTGEQLESWAAYMHARMGWDHLLSGRSYRFKAVKNNVNGYSIADTELGDNFQLAGFPTLHQIAQDIRSDPKRPHLYEERHTYRRWGVDMDKTRRLMWRTAIVGGMGGWYGHFPIQPKRPDRIRPDYPNPEQMRTHYTFWHENNRFNLDAVELPGVAAGATLYSKSAGLYVIYVEDESAISMIPSKINGPFTAFAVDTKAAYAEVPIDIGNIRRKWLRWKLPHQSDWAIVIKEAKP